MRKRPFILLEVLIAFTLAVLCIVPLVKEPLHYYRTELKSLENLEKERIADWVFTEIQEQLLKNEIPWDSLPSFQKSTPRKALPPAQLHIPGCLPKQIPCFVSFYCAGEKEGLKGEQYKMLHVKIYFSSDEEVKSSGRFRLIVQKNLSH